MRTITENYAAFCVTDNRQGCYFTASRISAGQIALDANGQFTAKEFKQFAQWVEMKNPNCEECTGLGVMICTECSGGGFDEDGGVCWACDAGLVPCDSC